MRIGIVAAALTAAVLAAGAAGAQAVTDVLTIGTVSVPSGGTPTSPVQVKVPIFIQDNSVTTLDVNKPLGSRISGFALQVVYTGGVPSTCIDTPANLNLRIDHSLPGDLLASQNATFDDTSGKIPNTSQAWLYSSNGTTNGTIPFTLNQMGGNLIGAMVFNLSGCSNGTINLTITATGGAEAQLTSDNNGPIETVDNPPGTNPPGGLSVVNGAINIGRSLWTVAPCRVIDTRNPDGPLGGPALATGPARTFAIANQCGIPADATAVSVNVSITGPSAAGFLTFYPTGVSPPLVSTINYRAGQTRANNAILSLGPAGDFDVSCAGGGTVDLILDVNGYFK
jgi:hypothetical protein